MSRLMVGHHLTNGSAVTPIGICMVCERECDRQYIVYSRPTIGAQTPFFPILESLSGSSSQINVCNVCSQSLLNQWNEYESKQIPIKNRFYHLNRKPISNPKSAQILNNSTKQLNPNNGHKSSSAEEVLDLSFNSSSTSTLNLIKNNVKNEKIAVKQWTNRMPNICYICGEECHTIVSVLVRRISNCPYFPSLLSHPKPIGANPIDSNGRIDSCEACHRFLIQQWDHFQRMNIPISERQYSLRANASNSDRNRMQRYSCVLCNTEFSLSIQSVVISMLTLNDFNSDLKKLVLSSAQEFIIGSGASLEAGRVLTCINCFRNLIKNSSPSAPQTSAQIQPSLQMSDIKKKSALEVSVVPNDQHLCPLCHRIRNQTFIVETNPTPERKPFFPFLKDLVKTQDLDSLERVRICSICLTSIESQWEAFELALIPHNQRNYILPSSVSPVVRPLSSPGLKIVVSSPPPLQQSLVCEPLLTTVTTLTTQSHNTYCTTNSSKQYLHKNDSKISGPMDDILSVLGGPLLKSTNCSVCGEFSMAGHTFQLLTIPRVPPVINHELGIYPFFPFLKKLIAINAVNGDDRDVDNRSTSALVCTFCYHSLIGQWVAYNASPSIEDKDPMRRTYNYRDYICFICGVTTFRQRVRSIALKDFPFLLEHSRPPGALTLNNGENVVTCLTCFDSLTLQWKDYERMKVPIEMRKYNWITVAPPNRDLAQNDGPLPLVHNVESVSPPTLISVANSKVISNEGIHSSNRSSGFADVLRKLAKQSFEQSISGDQGLPQNLSNIPMNHTKNALSFQNSYQSPNIRPSPPIVTIAPIAAHQSIERSNDLRKGENPSFFEHRIHSDPSKESLLYSHSQRTSPIVQVRPSPSRVHSECLSSAGNHTTAQNNLSNRSSGFQPYRSGFEESGGSTPGLPSGPPLPSHLLPYEALGFPYHPFLPHSGPISGSSGLSNAVPHPSAPYRLADNYYLDRFGLLRGSLHSGSGLPLPGAGPGSGSGPSVPFNLVRYSELLSSQTERLINDERQRLLNQSLSQSVYKASPQTIESPVLHVNIGTNNGINSNNNNSNERLIESNSEPILLNHSMKADFGANHLSSGSILSGTPRDMGSGLQNLSRGREGRPSVANVSAVKPLNLSSNCEQPLNSGSEQIYLWRPQSDDRKEHPNNYAISSQMEGQQSSGGEHQLYNRRNSGFIIEDSIQTKGFRVNSFRENMDPFIDSNRITEKGMENTTTVSKPLCLSERHSSSEGLHSRILENNLEKSVVNDLTLNPNLIRSEVMANSESKTENICRQKVEPKVVSKLDLKEMKLKQKRVNRLNGEPATESRLTSDEESNQSDDSDDDSDDNDLKYNIILSKRMPLDLDTSEEKMQFLGIFKLTTHKRKSQMEFNKYIKRRRLLREESPESDPILVEEEPVVDQNKENPETGLTATDISPDRMSSEEKRIEVKVHFMSTLGLCAETCSERKRTVELLWTGIIKERQIRIKRNKCWAKVLNNLSEETLHKWLIGLQSSASQFDSRFHSNGFIQNNSLTNCKTIASNGSNGSLDSNSSRFQRKVILFNKQTNDPKSSSLPMSNRSRIHSNKDFAQEFHESVLLETTIQQQSRHGISEQHNTTARNDVQPVMARHYADFSSSSAGYKWPGIETVMEAYDRYSYDRNQEKDFLHERTHQLKSKLQDINREAEYLSQKMANLLQTRSHLDEERQHYETTLDALKTCLTQMR